LIDAQWSDGTEVTAFDFEYAWKTILSPAFHSESASDLYIIKNGQDAKMGRVSMDAIGIRALDAKTLQVDLTHPVPYFPGLTAGHLFFPIPKHIAEKSPNWADSASSLYVSNGPFLLKKWQRNNKILLEKNELYWDKDAVQLTKISFSLIEDENTELAMFENQEIDWCGTPFSSLPLDALPSLKKKDKVIIHPISGTYYYVFNTKLFPFNNVHIRRAFSLAINRQMITENIMQSGQLPATALIPPTMWKEDRHYFKDHDALEAKKVEATIFIVIFKIRDLIYNGNVNIKFLFNFS
jgi:oligopeptide transport system substrate-binding protein